MNKFITKLFVLIAIPASMTQITLAQTGVSPYYQVQEPLSGRIIVIPAGTTFEGRIGSTIGSSVSKQGERFTITVSSPVLANGSDVLIPAGAEVMGEVVQAVPSSKVPVTKVPHQKKEKPPGQLRVQITALKMPDGMTFPMVASLAGEEAVELNHYGGYSGSMPKNPTLGSGVGYVGTQSGFHSVAPGPRQRNNYGYGNTSPVVTKEEMMSDPILGRDHDMDGGNHNAIRSLVKKNRELYIYSGSPLTVRLEAPFKMGMSSSAGEASALGVKPLQSEESSIPTQTQPPAGQIQTGNTLPVFHKNHPDIWPGDKIPLIQPGPVKLLDNQPIMPPMLPIPPQHPSQSNMSPGSVPVIPSGQSQDSNF